MTIKIFTKDQDTVIAGNAIKDDGTKYLQSEIASINILREGPRNDPTVYPKVAAEFNTAVNTDNSFTGTIPGVLTREGYWKFQLQYVLTGGKPVHSKKIAVYVGPTIESV
ncbi:hypothetical protein K0U27_00690 [archaeon]|nr:hypothetical protein [archaeon]